MGAQNAEFKTILFPTDFSDVSEAAACYALSMARKYRAGIVAVHVVDVSEEAAGFYVPHMSFDSLDEEMTAGAGNMLKKFCSRVFKGFRSYETRVVTGEPYKEILKAVKSEKADLVVMGSLGRGRLEKFIFGSTAERVMRQVNCPVLVVPPSK